MKIEKNPYQSNTPTANVVIEGLMDALNGLQDRIEQRSGLFDEDASTFDEDIAATKDANNARTLGQSFLAAHSHAISEGVAKGATNEERGALAALSLDLFAAELGANVDKEGVQSVMIDLVADMMHLCTHRGIEFSDVIAVAQIHHKHEIKEQPSSQAATSFSLHP